MTLDAYFHIPATYSGAVLIRRVLRLRGGVKVGHVPQTLSRALSLPGIPSIMTTERVRDEGDSEKRETTVSNRQRPFYFSVGGESSFSFFCGGEGR